MRRKMPSMSSKLAGKLVAAGLLIGGAAAPPPDCAPEADRGQTLPIPLDLAGRPTVSAGLAGHAFATPPSAEGNAGCRNPLPSVIQSTTSRGEAADALHGLPAPDLMQSMDQAKPPLQIQ
jgi:hypothetical protein